MKANLLVACALSAASILMGCSGGTDPTPGTGTSSTDGTDVAQALTMEPMQGGLGGQFVFGTRTLTFKAITTDGSTDVVVVVDGMSLTALVDTKSQVGEIDGFATSNGQDTQITDDDRAVLTAFDKAVDLQVANDKTLPEEAKLVSRMADLWAETPSSAPLTRQVIGQENRSYNSICSQYGTYQYATHDDWNYNDWNAKSTSLALVGSRWSGTTSYLVNNSWTTKTQDHKPYLYEAGDCYGRCGADCSSGDQVLTTDCNNHDNCVRNGHAIASMWCDDEFSACVDDFAFAPSCGGTSHD
ncbi:MAG TPA: hypothetical protein VF407_23475 [Polyangiaceae bacterium]